MTSDEYILNSKRYAQKLDGTAASAAVHQFHDPTHTIESVIRRMVIKMMEDHQDTNYLSDDQMDIQIHRRIMEKEMVKEDYSMPKCLCQLLTNKCGNSSATKCLKVFSRHTHTHTHTRRNIFSPRGYNQCQRSEGRHAKRDARDGRNGRPPSEGDCQGYQDSSSYADEGGDESASEDTCVGNDFP